MLQCVAYLTQRKPHMCNQFYLCLDCILCDLRGDLFYQSCLYHYWVLCMSFYLCHSWVLFRLEQPNLALNAGLFDGLCHCTSLQRLCIIAKHSSYQSPDITRLMEQVRGHVSYRGHSAHRHHFTTILSTHGPDYNCL